MWPSQPWLHSLSGQARRCTWSSSPWLGHARAHNFAIISPPFINHNPNRAQQATQGGQRRDLTVATLDIETCSLSFTLPLLIRNPIRAVPRKGSWIFEFSIFGGNVDFGNFPVGFGVWQGVQSIDASCGIQMDGFSARMEPPESFSTILMD